MWEKKMYTRYEKEYSLITGITEFPRYTTPEEQANEIKKCTILKRTNMTFSDRVEKDNLIQNTERDAW